MAQNSFASPAGLGMPSGGLASRRGGNSIKPLSFDTIKAQPSSGDNGAPTPRTSRSHLLAGLRTAPKSATTGNFPASPTTAAPTSQQMYGNNSGMTSNMYAGQQAAFNGPKTSLPRMPSQQQQPQQQQQRQPQHRQQQSYGQQMMGAGQQQQQHQYSNGQHYTAEQILPPPEIQFDDQEEEMDPLLYAQMMQANLYLAQQQQRLQQQLMQVQAAAQQFQGLSLNGQATVQQQIAISTLYQQQQQQLRNLQQQMASMPTMQQMQQPQQHQQQQNICTYYDPSTGQTYYVDQSQVQNGFGQANNVYMDQPSTPQGFSFQQNNTPRVQVSPPADNEKPFFRSNSPPKKMELTGEPEPLPPPSANAFRRGHKKSTSNAGSNQLSLATDGAPRTAGPKSSSFPISPMPNAYGPGQARAGEHPLRQPRGPPAIDELRAKPTSRHEGSKNFAARTRRSALNNLVRAGFERRKGTGSSSGSMSPVSETAEEVGTPLTDNESDSGRSGSGSLSGDAEPSLASSRTSASGSWGAIGSDRPSSRQKTRKSVDSLSSQCDSDSGSFASVFKKGSQRDSKPQSVDGQRKAPRLVLTSAEKRKGGMTA
ncbi:hypothetical protein PG985_011040 [Apiospora marii]|uniref:Uncharacterized protein n=1 Tax=Apiospora marii TaxID=335849 RepID=A0ABR1SUD1_9PEZI